MYRERIENTLNKAAKAYRVVDLRSDTMTIPTPEIRQAIFDAQVGDDVYGEDPSINELEITVAKMFEKEAALFTISGSMSNLLAVMVHCDKRGSEVFMGHLTHACKFEQGNASTIANVFVNTLQILDDGTFDINSVRNNVKTGADPHEPISQLVCIETSNNFTGGRVPPMSWVDEISSVCKDKNLKLHIDGARIFNAAEYLKLPVSRISRDADSISFCLSKGLCCPGGSLLVGSKAFIATARRLRKALGGGFRQAGFLAAAGLCALETILPTLALDHTHNFLFAKAIDDLKSSIFAVDMQMLHTNILMIIVKKNPKNITAVDLSKRMAEVNDNEVKQGICDSKNMPIVVKSCALGNELIRVVFYHQITDELTSLGIMKVIHVMKELEGSK